MSDSSTGLITTVVERLRMVIDPETGADVIRMRLIEDVTVDADGVIHYTFRPSSPVCPLAVPLAVEIYRAISEVEGVTGQRITVKGYLHSESLAARLNVLGAEGS